MITVVIPTYNEEKNIERCLKQFENQTMGRKKFSIVVVDGGSTDRTRQLARKYADKVILQKSKGIGGARNDGVLAAEHDLIATTDADTVLPDDWLEKILKHFEDKEVVGVCGSDGPVEKDLKARIIFYFLRNLIRFLSKLGMYCMGGDNAAFRKEPFMKIGGYKSWPHSDDVELGFRLKKVGKIKYDGKLYVGLSVRRMKKKGYLKVLLTWLKGNVCVLLGIEVESKENYAKQQY